MCTSVYMDPQWFLDLGGRGGPDTQLSLGLMHSSLLLPHPWTSNWTL